MTVQAEERKREKVAQLIIALVQIERQSVIREKASAEVPEGAMSYTNEEFKRWSGVDANENVRALLREFLE